MEQNNTISDLQKHDIIGILGGMGPLATADFYNILLSEVGPTIHDNEYPHVIISSNPKMPSRTRAFLYDEEDPTPYLIKELNMLKNIGASFVVCPCNSAHYFLRQIKTPPINYIDIVSETLEHCKKNKIHNCIVLGGEVTVQSNMYGDSLNIVKISEEDKKTTRSIIDAVKKGDRFSQCDLGKAFIYKLCREYIFDAIVLACTELSFLDMYTTRVPTIDSTRILARAALREAKIEPRN